WSTLSMLPLIVASVAGLYILPVPLPRWAWRRGTAARQMIARTVLMDFRIRITTSMLTFARVVPPVTDGEPIASLSSETHETLVLTACYGGCCCGAGRTPGAACAKRRSCPGAQYQQSNRCIAIGGKRGGSPSEGSPRRVFAESELLRILGPQQ